MESFWTTPAFIDWSIAGTYSVASYSLGMSCCNVTGYVWGLQLVSNILDNILTDSLLKLPEYVKSALSWVRQIFPYKGPAGDLAYWTRLSSLKPTFNSATGSSIHLEHHLTTSVAHITSLASDTIARIRVMHAGDVICLPIGIGLSKMQEPIYLLMIVFKPKINSLFFNVAIINVSGVGNEYHAYRLEDTLGSGTIRRDGLLVLTNVIPERLMHSSFWIAVYRLLLRPGSMNMKIFYTVLLPHLNRKPLLCNWVTSKSCGVNSKLGGYFVDPPPDHQPGRCVIGSMALLFFLLQLVDSLKEEEIRVIVSILLRWGSLLGCCRDLKRLGEGENTESRQVNHPSENFFNSTFLLNSFQLQVVQNAIRCFCLNLALELDMYKEKNTAILCEDNFLIFKTTVNWFKTIFVNQKALVMFPKGIKYFGGGYGVPSKVLNLQNTFNNEYPDCFMFPWFGRFTKMIQPDRSKLEENTLPLPLILPVNLTTPFEKKIETLDDVCTMLRNAHEACVLLGNQRDKIFHSYILRFQLIRNIILNNIPLPLPLSYAGRGTHCFWASQELQRKTKTELMRLLHSIAKHFITVCFSLSNSRDMDAQRIIVMAAICVMIDAILRTKLQRGDEQFPLGNHYSGDILGPVLPFCFDVRFFSDQSEFFLLLDPILNVTRTQILDYMHDLHKNVVKNDQVLFCFEECKDLDSGCRKLLEQISLQYGFPHDISSLIKYFTGKNTEFSEFIPEWVYLRDIVFYFKALMIPDGACLPDLKRWSVSDATLKWSYNATKGQLAVLCFDSTLDCFGFVKGEECQKRLFYGGGALTKFLGWLGMSTNRTPPSAADPSNLIEKHGRIETEDDVLYLKKLPDFNGKLTASETEVVLQYLTVPYLRIPLILQFFSNVDKIDALSSSADLRNVLMASLFEPSLWQPEMTQCTSTGQLPFHEVPPENRICYGTPLGLLFNELVYAPLTVLTALERLLDIALQRDAGHVESPGLMLILFVTRLTVIIIHYVDYVINHHAKWAFHVESKSMCGSYSLARGLKLPTTCARVALEKMKQKLKERIESDVLPLLEERAIKAVKTSNLGMACVLHAHILYIFKNELPEDERNMMRFVGALLYVMIHHRFSLEAKEKEHGVVEDNSTAVEIMEKNCLGVSEMEIFLILETHRLRILKWFRKHETEANSILESSLALVSYAPFTQTRSWKELSTFGGRGRMVPSIQANLIEATQSQILSFLQSEIKKNDRAFSWSSLTQGLKTSGVFNSVMQRSLIDIWGSSWSLKQPKDHEMSLYESWLRAVTCRTNDTELNFQLGDFSLKNKQFHVLDPRIKKFQEFQDLFESTGDSQNEFQAVVIQHTEKRYWCRLIGLQHDLDCWDFDARCTPYMESQMPYCSENLRPSETWVTGVIDSWVERHLPGVQLFLVRYPEQCSNTRKTKNKLFESTLKDTILDDEVKCVHLMCTWPVMPQKKASLETKSSSKQHIKEIVITKNPTTITVFDIVEHGRGLFSVPCYTSDMNMSYCFPFSNENNQGVAASISRVSENKTLCIIRDIFSEIGFKQRYVPSVFLHGLIPGYLLTQYCFWQNIDQEACEHTVLFGYLKDEKKSDTKRYPFTQEGSQSHTSSLLKITVYATSGVYETHHWFFDKKASASAVVEKISFVESFLDGKENSGKSPSIKNQNVNQWCFRQMHKLLENQCHPGVTRQFLVNLRDVQKGSALEELRDSLLRIEDLSCVLVWAQIDSQKEYMINVIEYPRLGLSFSKVLDKGRPSITRKWWKSSDKHTNDENTTNQWQSTRFECDQHAGFFLTCQIVWPHCLLARLTGSIANGILLENHDGKLFLLVDALAKPCRLPDEKSSVSFSKGQNENLSVGTKNTVEPYYETMSYNAARYHAANHVAPTLILNRHDSVWIENLKEAKYYLYSIHASNSFLFCPTPAAALYLLLLRFIAKEYTQVCHSLGATYLFDHLMNEQIKQIWGILNTLNADFDSHPDAHATRMKLWLNASRYSCFASKREPNVLQNILKTTSQQFENHQYVKTFLKMSKWCQDEKKSTENTASQIDKNENILRLWDLEIDLLGYVEKLPQVSGECRLTVSEELELLTMFRTFVEKTSVLHNRQMFLQKILKKKKSNFLQTLTSCDVFSRMPSSISVPGMQLTNDFDIEDDRTAIEGSYNPAEWVNEFLGTLISFKRTDDALKGAAATLFFIKVLDRGITLRLFSDFHFIYELLTEGPTCSNISVIPMESTFQWGALFTRFLVPQDFSVKSELMSVLRIIIANPHLTTSWPRLKDEKRHRLQLSLILRSQETFQTFLKDILLQIRDKEKKGFLSWPVIDKIPSKEIINQEAICKEKICCLLDQRLTLAGTQKDTSCNVCEIHPVSIQKYEFPFSDFKNSSQLKNSNISLKNIQNFSTFPLAEYIDIGNLIEMKIEKKEKLNFEPACLLVSNLKKKSFCKTFVGKETVQRFDAELTAYQEQLSLETKPCLNFLPEERFTSMLRDKEDTRKVITEVEKIRETLLTAYKLDTEFIESSIFYVEQLANFPVQTALNSETDEDQSVSIWAFVFYKLGALEPYITVDVLIEWLISSTGTKELLFWNPFCSKERSQDIFSVLGAILFTVNRLNQICQAFHESFLLQQEMYQTIHEKDEKCLKICETSMKLKTFNFIQILMSQRHYVTKDHTGSSIYDPRFLAFEFAYTLLLRKQQIELIYSFLKAVKEKKSLCHQAVMGAGKTTIVAPLLAILLADQADLIVQVVPATLLEFTKTIFQERFSAILKKGVMTFSFSRYETVTPQLLSSFLQAKENKNVCLSTPTDLKSIFLKVVYLFYVLQNSTQFNNELPFEKLLHSSQMYRKLRGAVNNLLQIPLEFQLEKDKYQRLSNEEFGMLRRELDLCLRVLHLFKSSILIIDEVDLILHPLKSELHWPIGPRQPLAFTHISETVSMTGNVEEGLRWKLPWYLLEPFFFVQCNPQSGRLSLPVGTSRQVGQILEEFEVQINKGLTEQYLQTTPHLVLLDEKYYHVHLKPHLARWMNLHLRSLGYHGLKSEETIQLLCLPISSGVHDPDTANNQLIIDAEEKLDKLSVDLLNLCRLWINSLLPHTLEKINRVGYGLMTPHEIRQKLIQNSSMPASRQLLAVPFSGKDTPSATSEFAHPDIVIGFTILAYRYTGMRYYDFVNIIHHHKKQLGDGFGPVHERPSAVAFKTWVTVAGGSIRAFEKSSCLASKYGSTEWVMREACRTNVEQYYWRGLTKKNDKNCEILPQSNAFSKERKLSGRIPRENCLSYWKKNICSPSPHMYNVVRDENDYKVDKRLFEKIKPLQFISLEEKDNKEELFLIYDLLWREPLVIQSLLFDVIFPLTLRHCTEQFSASGQELGSSMLFPIRLGFSGTPNALLPFELNKTVYQRGIYGKMVHSLTSLNVTSLKVLEDQWSVESLLDLIASTSDINAFIDTGAFIMGFSNLEVAKILLKRGLKKMDGFVYFDEYDRQMVLLRDEGKIIKLAQCGLALEKRFTFYDQVHTTGQDIKQHPTAKALLTIGKDMTFRDIAQGSWRMRRIGMGQKIIFLITPEILRLITNSCEEKHLNKNDSNRQCPMLRDTGNYSHLLNSKELCYMKSTDVYNEDTKMFPQSIQDETERLLINILQWSIEKGICGELLQYRLLLEENICTLWRRNAFCKLCEMHSQIGAAHADEMLRMSLNIFRDSMMFPIPSSTLDSTTTSRRLEKLMGTFSLFLESEADKYTAQMLMKSLVEYEKECQSAETLGLVKLELNSFETQVVVEQEQEQEQEEEAEEEEEHEQEEEEEKEQARESLVLNTQNFVRPSESILRWKLNELSIPPLNAVYQEKSFLAYAARQTQHTVFLPLSQFTISCLSEKEPVAQLNFPSCVWASRNAVDFKRSSTTNHRLKNVLIVMEWIPDFQQNVDGACAKMKTCDAFDVSHLIEKVFYIFDRNQTGYISLGVARYLLLLCGCFVAEDAIWHEIKYSICDLLQKKYTASEERDKVSFKTLNVSVPQRKTFMVYQGKKNRNENPHLMEKTEKRIEEPENSTWISCSDLQHIVKELSLLNLDSLYPQRYYVFLSLEEAEAVRAALHVAIKNGYESVIPTKHVKVVLRNVLAQFCSIDTLHENGKEDVHAKQYNGGIRKQRQIAHAFFRFFNSEALYSDEHVEYLLRYLSQQSPHLRQVFYNAVLFRRRRAAIPLNIQQKRLFQADNDIFLVQLKSLALRVCYELSERGLSLSDAFVVMDTDSSGRMNAVQLYAGLRWLGIRIEINDFLKIWNHLPKFFAQESCLESDFVFEFTPFNNMVDEFRRFAYVADLNFHWKNVMQENTLINTNFKIEENTLKFFSQQNITSNISSGFTFCPLKIDQLLTKDEKRQLVGEFKVSKTDVNYQKLLESKACERLKFRLQAHTSFVKVWEGFLNDEHKTSPEACTSCEEAKKFSIWRPDHLECRYRALTKRNRERICLGDFICEGTDCNKIFNEKSVNGFSPLVLEVEDPKASYFADKGVIPNVIDVLLPHPIRFKPIVQDIQNVSVNNVADKKFTIWQPVPPDQNLFVHSGYVVTCSEKPPSLDIVRCVPLKWTQKGASTVLCKLCLKSTCRQPVSLCVSHTTHQLDLYPYFVNELQSTQFRLSCQILKRFPKNSSAFTPTKNTHRGDCRDFLTGDVQFTNETSDSEQQEDYIPELIPKKKAVLSKLWF